MTNTKNENVSLRNEKPRELELGKELYHLTIRPLTNSVISFGHRHSLISKVPRFKKITEIHERYGFKKKKDLKRHHLNQDKSGRTLGCGCAICILRHAEYTANQAAKHFKQERVKYKGLLSYMRHLSKNGIPITPNDLIFDKIGKKVLLFGSTIIPIRTRNIGGGLIKRKELQKAITKEPLEEAKRLYGRFVELEYNSLKKRNGFKRARKKINVLIYN